MTAPERTLFPVVQELALRGLGRLCEDPETSGLAWGAGAPGFERLAATFTGVAYGRHRHDTYGLALTLRGVQTFSYRGAEHRSVPGQVIVLHPDEPHTGSAGTAAGLTYRMLYLDPALLRAAAGDAAVLPFLRDPVTSDPPLRRILGLALAELTIVPDSLLMDAVTAALAEHLSRLAGARDSAGRVTLDPRRLDQVRDYLIDHALLPVVTADLTAVAGIDRYQLARQFRARFGTSPYQFLLGRRLRHARRLIESGLPLAAVAADAGFADQSHLSRRFKRAYGLPPGAWRALIRRQETGR